MDWSAISSLAGEVIIVFFFLTYMNRKDKQISAIAERCHKTQEAGHAAIKELTVAVMRSNGR